MSTATPAIGRTSAGSEQALNLALKVIRLGPALILLALLVIMSLASPFFLTGDNLSNVRGPGRAARVPGDRPAVRDPRRRDRPVGRLGARAVHRDGRARLRLGRLRRRLVIPMMLVTGMAVGALNGIMLVKGRMPHAFIPTLATLNAARGLALLLSDGAPMPGMPQLVQTIGSGEVGPIPVAGARRRRLRRCSRGSSRRGCSGAAGSTSSAPTRRRRGASASRSTG